ncbi:hypothetical protein CHS0354_001615 [Potamilus streckersoni]|uniref:C2H2-type domain-containing protein n=1 Tax=Potamilus streckersoni TaxID=2493646 RepID=A0AAE0T2V7_9BIVA|nr:hypothetical protein CHS0354_001615 [Potamilus streckersoni]
MENLGSEYSYGSDALSNLSYPSTLTSSHSSDVTESRQDGHQNYPHLRHGNMGAHQHSIPSSRGAADPTSLDIPRFHVAYPQNININFNMGAIPGLTTPELLQQILGVQQQVGGNRLTNISTYNSMLPFLQQSNYSNSLVADRVEALPAFNSILSSASGMAMNMNMYMSQQTSSQALQSRTNDASDAGISSFPVSLSALEAAVTGMQGTQTTSSILQSNVASYTGNQHQSVIQSPQHVTKDANSRFDRQTGGMQFPPLNVPSVPHLSGYFDRLESGQSGTSSSQYHAAGTRINATTASLQHTSQNIIPENFKSEEEQSLTNQDYQSSIQTKRNIIQDYVPKPDSFNLPSFEAFKTQIHDSERAKVKKNMPETNVKGGGDTKTTSTELMQKSPGLRNSSQFENTASDAKQMGPFNFTPSSASSPKLMRNKTSNMLYNSESRKVLVGVHTEGDKTNNEGKENQTVHFLFKGKLETKDKSKDFDEEPPTDTESILGYSIDKSKIESLSTGDDQQKQYGSEHRVSKGMFVSHDTPPKKRKQNWASRDNAEEVVKKDSESFQKESLKMVIKLTHGSSKRHGEEKDGDGDDEAEDDDYSRLQSFQIQPSKFDKVEDYSDYSEDEDPIRCVSDKDENSFKGLFKDLDESNEETPAGKKVKRSPSHPFAITSPSYNDASAKAVMTTTVADNATIITISIMSKGSSALVPQIVSSEAAKGGIVSVVNLGKSETRTGEGREKDAEAKDVEKVGVQKTSIMSKLKITQKEKEKEEKQCNAVDENELEKVEINIKIDDEQCIVHGEQKRWQCRLCPKSYTTKHNLVTHILDHSGIKPHLCMMCGKYFKQLSHLNTHMLTHDNVKPHKCHICSKGFTQISHLKRHHAVHLDSKPYICDICGRGFAYPSELRAHKEKHAFGKDRCLECGEEFPSSKELRQHMLTHEHCSDLTCKHCNKIFRFPSQLKDHMITHAGSRPYICAECGMDFMKEHHLKAHQFTHTGLRPFNCPHCGRSFNQKANMQRHMLIHNAQRSFKCEVCGKTFTQPQTLKAHMVVHADKKPYSCKFCGKQFGRLHNLQGHLHMHNNSKPYVCFCGSSFTLKGNLNRHKKVKHGLNETTESMEEEAVNFLSELSAERAKVEVSDDPEEETRVSDVSMEAKSPKKGRKSIPRKIERRDETSEAYNTDSELEAEEERKEEAEEDFTSRYFQPLVSADPPVERRHSRRKSKRTIKVEEEVEDDDFEEYHSFNIGETDCEGNLQTEPKITDDTVSENQPIREGRRKRKKDESTESEKSKEKRFKRSSNNIEIDSNVEPKYLRKKVKKEESDSSSPTNSNADGAFKSQRRKATKSTVWVDEESSVSESEVFLKDDSDAEWNPSLDSFSVSTRSRRKSQPKGENLDSLIASKFKKA